MFSLEEENKKSLKHLVSSQSAEKLQNGRVVKPPTHWSHQTRLLPGRTDPSPHERQEARGPSCVPTLTHLMQGPQAKQTLVCLSWSAELPALHLHLFVAYLLVSSAALPPQGQAAYYSQSPASVILGSMPSGVPAALSSLCWVVLLQIATSAQGLVFFTWTTLCAQLS